MDLRLILHGNGGYVGAGDQISSYASGNQIPAKMRQMPSPRINRDYLRELELPENEVHGLGRRRRMSQYAGVGHQPHKAG